VSFWRVGKGIAAKLERYGMFTMGDVARMSLSRHGEDLLYKLFGVNAELLIDHAWGWEPCTMAAVKSYKPASNSICSGQVLQEPYDFAKARLVVHEMTDMLALDLVDKNLVTDQIVLTIGYDIENLTDPVRRSQYKGQVTTDSYGRKIPKHAHGTTNIECQTSSAMKLTEAVLVLYDRIVDPALLVRRVSISVNRLVDERTVMKGSPVEQLDLFTDYETILREREQEEAALEKEKKIQHTLLNIKKRFGKNAVLKGMNLEEGATAQERNNQIGGHKA
jgi:DNA polymerase V